MRYALVDSVNADAFAEVDAFECRIKFIFAASVKNLKKKMRRLARVCAE